MSKWKLSLALGALMVVAGTVRAAAAEPEAPPPPAPEGGEEKP